MLMFGNSVPASIRTRSANERQIVGGFYWGICVVSFCRRLHVILWPKMYLKLEVKRFALDNPLRFNPNELWTECTNIIPLHWAMVSWRLKRILLLDFSAFEPTCNLRRVALPLRYPWCTWQQLTLPWRVTSVKFLDKEELKLKNCCVKRGLI